MMHSIRWTLPKIEQRLTLIEPMVYRHRRTIPPFRYATLADPLDTPPVGKDVDDSAWDVIEPLEHWGESLTNFILRSEFSIPDNWDQGSACALYLPLGEAGDFSHPEALIYVDGSPYAACDRHHQEVMLRADWHDGSPHALALHGWTGLGASGIFDVLLQAPGAREQTEVNVPPRTLKHLLMRPCEVVQIDQPTRDFVTTVRVTIGAINAMSENVPARGKLLYALDAAFKLLNIREPIDEAFYSSILQAAAVLHQGIEQAGPALDVTVGATGHAHIDVAWLWTLGQTRRKAGRTFHTVMRLMEQFPDYHFTQSQPQLYDYIRQDYPELFKAIQARVAEGRWEITGGMWVEADCNLSGPESLARQFLLGRSFFEKYFGLDLATPVLWLPDVFGYSWALPQLIKKAGLEYFFTIKIGWNQYNRLPYDSFWWQGIDGTRVLTHFGTTPDGGGFVSTYNAKATSEQLMGTWTNFTQKDLGRGTEVPPLLMAYGYGDGGGGPTREMLENIDALANFPGLPHMQQQNVGEFFSNLEAGFGDILPVWNGELYLELHRGTYTTQSNNKRANRFSEFLLHDSEYLAALATLLNPAYEYPHAAFHQAWELICLNQFHDIIPGSSVTQVYQQSLQQYAQLRLIAEQARDGALQTIAQHLQSQVMIVNPNSFMRTDLAFWQDKVPAGWHLENTQSGEPVYTQESAQGTWLATDPYHPYSVLALSMVAGEASPPVTDLRATPSLLENSYVRVEFNQDGDITRIFDKKHTREVVAPGALANQFQAFEDRPKNWDAWDIDVFYDDKMWTADPATSISVVEEGPLRATLQIERRILHSLYTQRISLAYNGPELDIETTIDWHERHVLLKVAFPVDILSPVATYEIQWGNVQRPTHRNTSWDWARFETCAQKWVDLSEGDYGVSLLNNGKYGHDIHENVMRISLLRSPTSPDPIADQGLHTFTYSILPHKGHWTNGTVGAAYALNDPLIVYGNAATSADAVAANDPTSLDSLVAVEQPNMVIETIKQAEDGRGLIVRLYESQRIRGPITLSISFALKGAWSTDLMENDEQPLETDGQQVHFAVHPYEIVTLRLLPED